MVVPARTSKNNALISFLTIVKIKVITLDFLLLELEITATHLLLREWQMPVKGLPSLYLRRI